MIDRLDDFVIQKDCETQRVIIEALLHCQRGYATNRHVEIKLFLRTDIFERLNFEALGFDKVSSKKVELRWSPAGS